jgi:WD40 repeat protein/energy-coupling factor transporter ATP-binding protein EcfA2
MSMQVAPGFDAQYEVPLPDFPYPGLRPFREDEWAIFFGRENIIEHVVGKLVDNRFVSVHGDSGSGKSSLVRAGVLPRLMQDVGRGGGSWRTATMEPGNAPLHNLAAAFSELCESDGQDRLTQIRRILNLGADASGPLIKELRRNEHDHLCILVDQFEEIFAFAREHPGTEAELFIDVLTGIQRQKPEGLHIILTMRSEYLGACARFTGLAEAINDTQYLLPPMRRAALIRAIREPAVLYGGQVAMDLAERLIADAGSSQDQLPLIQHGLMVMQRRLSKQEGSGVEGGVNWVLSLEDYRKTKGVVQFLSDHADDVLNTIVAKHKDARPVMETVFRALTEIDADGNAIRQRQTLQQLSDKADVEPEKLAQMLAPMRADGVSFLRPYGDGPVTADDEISISHEALIRCWKQIADPKSGWLQEEFKDGLIWKTLLVAADGYAEDNSAVLSPAVTTERELWMVGRSPAWAERYGGRFEDVAELLNASAANLRRQRLTKSLLGFMIIGVVGLGIFILTTRAENEDLKLALADVQRQKDIADDALAKAEKATADAILASARAQENLARLTEEQDENKKLRSQLLAQRSGEASASGDAGSGLAMALEVLQDQTELPYVPEAERATYSALYGLRERVVFRDDSVLFSSAQYSPDGTRIVSSGSDGTVRVWSSEGGRAALILDRHKDWVVSAQYSPDGTRIVSASLDQTVRVWQADSGAEVLVLSGHEAPVPSAQFSPDGGRIVSAGADGTVRVWLADSGTEFSVLTGHEGQVGMAAFNHDGTRIVSVGDDATVRVWSSDGSGEALILTGHEGPVLSARFGPDGARIVSAGEDGTVRVWSLDGSGETLILTGHEGPVLSAWFSPDGTRIASAGLDGTVRVWLSDGTGDVLTLRGHEGQVGSAQFSPDGTRIVSASEDGTLRIWSLETAMAALRVGPSRIADAQKNIAAQVSQEFLQDLIPFEGSRNSLSIAPSGGRIIRSTASGLLGTWNLEEGQELVADREPDLDFPRVLATGFAGERPVAILGPHSSLLPFEFLIGNRRYPASPMTIKVPGAVAFSATQSRAALYFSNPSHVELYDLSSEPKLIAWVLVHDLPEGTDPVEYLMAFDSDGETITAVSRTGDRRFIIDWSSMEVLPRPEEGRPYNFSTRVTERDVPTDLSQILALNILKESTSIVSVAPVLLSPFQEDSALPTNEIRIGDLNDPEGFETVRPASSRSSPFAASFNVNGNRVALISEQGVDVYDREIGGIIARFTMAGKQLVTAEFANDGTALAAMSADGTLGYWPLFPTTEALREFAEDVAPRRLTQQQIDSYLEPQPSKR